MERNGVSTLFVLPSLVYLVEDKLLIWQISLTEHNQVLVEAFEENFLWEESRMKCESFIIIEPLLSLLLLVTSSDPLVKVHVVSSCLSWCILVFLVHLKVQVGALSIWAKSLNVEALVRNNWLGFLNSQLSVLQNRFNILQSFLCNSFHLFHNCLDSFDLDILAFIRC